jgi:hypothetical protein
MTKLIMALGGAGLAALATVLAVALAGSGQPTTSVGTLPAPAATVTAPSGTTVPEAGEDVSGPCDEAEHANDPRCTGATAPQTQADDDGVNHDAGDDHGNDAAEANDDHGDHGNDDRGGHGGGGGDDDRSGSSSGRG